METTGAAGGCMLTIIVKALNEERHIEACLRSALAEIGPGAGEVVLVDSLSTDRTVEIAVRFDVRIVQFESRDDRNCGAALQLGYQFARGRYLYVLDGDMTLKPGFIAHAIAYLEAHPDVAGVGGRLIDSQVLNAADKMRVAQYDALRAEQDVKLLGGGGLYRRGAIEAVGYLANRWLPAFEEAELGARLSAARWRLVRLAMPAVGHCGHPESSFQLMARLWRIGRVEASGAFLRAAFGRPWLRHALRTCWFVFVAPALYLAALAAGAAGFAAGFAFLPGLGAALLGLWGAAFAGLLWRKRDVKEVLIALMAWHMYPLGAARGFVRSARDPAVPIPARVLKAG